MATCWSLCESWSFLSGRNSCRRNTGLCFTFQSKGSLDRNSRWFHRADNFPFHYYCSYRLEQTGPQFINMILPVFNKYVSLLQLYQYMFLGVKSTIYLLCFFAGKNGKGESTWCYYLGWMCKKTHDWCLKLIGAISILCIYWKISKTSTAILIIKCWIS